MGLAPRTRSTDIRTIDIMTRKLTPYSLAIAIVVLPASVQAQQWTPQQQEVWQAVEDCWAAWFAKDKDTHKACFHDDYQFWPASQAAPFGKDRLDAFWTHVRDAQRALAYDVDPVRIAVHGDAALVHWSGLVWYGDSDGGVADAESYQEAMMMVLEDGRWQFFGGAGSVIDR